MKYLITILILFTIQGVAAQKIFSERFKKYHEATITYNNRNVQKGWLVRNNLQKKIIKYKTDKKNKAKVLDVSNVKTITYHFKYWNISYDKIRTLSKNNNIKDPIWMKVLIRGYLTLYIDPAEMSFVTDPISGTTHPVSGTTTYYLKRDNEEFATFFKSESKIINKDVFIEQATEYFSDYTELVQKIKNKKYKYENINMIVYEYNLWKSQQ